MKIIVVLISLLVNVCSYSQETTVLLKEAYNLELKFNETDALAKYKQVLINEPINYKSLQKAVELSCTIGARTTATKDKRLMFESGLAFAKRAFMVDSVSANSYYLLSITSSKMAEVEDDNKKRAAFARDAKMFADKALAINPNHGLANFCEGRWHYEMVTLNWAKKLAIKTIYGGLSEPSLEKAIEYLEKCRKQEPYFVLNYVILVKAYKEDNKAVQMIEVLNQLVKLPKRNFDDIAYIEEAKKLLEEEK
jgi:hypothetical protein